jgi:hypothetical protein
LRTLDAEKLAAGAPAEARRLLARAGAKSGRRVGERGQVLDRQVR